jgi:hypothetical protein
MILWGDSFADGLQESVDAAVSSLGVSGIVATEGGCPPFKGKVFAGSGAEVFSGCEKYSNFVFDYFEHHPEISTAVVAGDWQRYAPEYEGNILKRIAQILASRGGYMILVTMVPNPRADVPREWTRIQFQAGRSITEWSVPLAREADLIAHGDRIASIAREAGNVIIVDPFRALCDSDACYAVKHGEAWYSDTDHLSAVGVKQLVPDLTAAIGRAIARDQKQDGASQGADTTQSTLMPGTSLTSSKGTR